MWRNSLSCVTDPRIFLVPFHYPTSLSRMASTKKARETLPADRKTNIKTLFLHRKHFQSQRMLGLSAVSVEPDP
jgi:hypothetical protein